MRTAGMITLGLWLLLGCQEQAPPPSLDPVNWEKRAAEGLLPDSLTTGASYLSVYSQIYSQSEHRTHDLTVTVSMRNVSRKDTVFLTQAELFDTHGQDIRIYFDFPIYLLPMETVEIVIAQLDPSGGTGGNFIFDWKIKPGSLEPLFEAVMISTYGDQGISFTSVGRRIE